MILQKIAVAVTVIVTVTVPGSWQLENADELWNLIARGWCGVVLCWISKTVLRFYLECV